MVVARISKKDRRGIEEGSKKGGGWELKIENWELKIGVDGDCGREGRCGENRFDRVDRFNREDRCDRNWKNGDWGREGRFGQEGMKKAETFAGLGFLCFRVSMHYYISESFL